MRGVRRKPTPRIRISSANSTAPQQYAGADSSQTKRIVDAMHKFVLLVRSMLENNFAWLSNPCSRIRIHTGFTTRPRLWIETSSTLCQLAQLQTVRTESSFPWTRRKRIELTFKGGRANLRHRRISHRPGDSTATFARTSLTLVMFTAGIQLCVCNQDVMLLVGISN